MNEMRRLMEAVKPLFESQYETTAVITNSQGEDIEVTVEYEVSGRYRPSTWEDPGEDVDIDILNIYDENNVEYDYRELDKFSQRDIDNAVKNSMDNIEDDFDVPDDY